jgi:hypothetical protein
MQGLKRVDERSELIPRPREAVSWEQGAGSREPKKKRVDERSELIPRPREALSRELLSEIGFG